MKLWILGVLFKKEFNKMHNLRVIMMNRDDRSRWDEGFICGLAHAEKELKGES